VIAILNEILADIITVATAFFDCVGRAAGNIYQSRTAEIKEYFDKQDWFFWSPEDIKEKVVSLAEKGYENEAAIITAKILMR